MERDYIMRNDRLKISDSTWLVLQNSQSFSLLIKLNDSKLNVIKVSSFEIINQISEEKIQLLLNRNDLNKAVNFDSLTIAQLKKYNNAVEMINYLLDRYSDLEWLIRKNEKVFIIGELATKFNLSERTVRRYILNYFQGGMLSAALIPQYSNCGKEKRMYKEKKVGPKSTTIKVRDQKVEEVFIKMTSRYLARGANVTYTKLYEEMVHEYYSDKKFLNGDIIYMPYPITQRPTLKQLRYWIQTHTDEAERQLKKQGKKAARNNFRPLFSDTIAHLDVKAIGSRYEMDEVETDFYLVNRINRNKPIGRAIVYFIIDVYSRAIVSCGIGLDNNSWSGAEIALLNLVENKKEFCTQYDIKIEEKDWPMQSVIPRSIMVDNGSEYLSKNFSDLAQEIGIGVDFVPPQMGSYKGNVEQKFRQMNILFKNTLPGVIDKEKYGQPHIKNARLDIYQMGQAVIEFILNYNKTPMDNYPETREMFENSLVLSPINIWNFSLSKSNELTYVNDKESYKYSLLKRDMAVITRNGIQYKKRFFICNDIEWLSREASNAALVGYKNRKLPIRYDLRNPDIIYFEKEGLRQKAFLNCPEVTENIAYGVTVNIKPKTSNSKYSGLTEPEIEDVINTKKQQKIETTEIKLCNNINTTNKVKNIVKDAITIHNGSNEKQNIRQNRILEKQRLHSEVNINVDADENFSPANIISEDNKQESIEECIDLKNMTRIQKFRWIEQQKNIK